MHTRRLHRWVGIAASGVGMVLALSGIFLATAPLSEAVTTGSLLAPPSISTAALASEITAQRPDVLGLKKSANHTVSVLPAYGAAEGPLRFDPVDMRFVPSENDTGLWTILKDLHRSFFLGDVGRAVAGLGAAAMLVLSISGMVIMARRMGGWRAILRPPKSAGAQRIHMDAVRVALPGLLVAGTTGVFLSLVTFSIVPDGQGQGFGQGLAGAEVDPVPAMALADMPALQAVPLTDLRRLVLPDPEFPGDPIVLETNKGTALVDPATGVHLTFDPLSPLARINEVIYVLHTGQGAWPLGIVLGLSMLAVPIAIVSGVYLALRRMRGGARSNVPAHQADTVILVGSEGDTTWGAADALADALSLAGKKVHVAAMNALAPSYPKAAHLLVLTATYGAGAAPASAQEFFTKLTRFQGANISYAVLGFGDRSFARFCQFAKDVDQALQNKALQHILPMGTVDRQDPAQFQTWAQDLGAAIGCSLTVAPQTRTADAPQLELIHTELLGQEVQAPVAILRFRAVGNAQLPRFEAGDLLAVLAPKQNRARFYSLASSHDHGVLEICVRQQQGGVCSQFLTTLKVGDRVNAYVQPNPGFKPSDRTTPMVLIGAGAGIGPLMGFLRNKPAERPAHLFWGGRHPKSDFLYQSELQNLSDSGRLTASSFAFSRLSEGSYVQNRLLEQAEELRALIRDGAEVLICGGGHMGRDVAASFDTILAPMGLSVATLKSEKRYLEDVY